MARRSIGTPLAIGIVLVVLLLALAVGWQVLVFSERPPLPTGLSGINAVLLVLGSIFFVVVLLGLVWLCLWLVREMRLNQSQRAFLDAVTHELKTPLASFRLYLDTLARHDPEPAVRNAFISRMREDLDRLDGTVQQVLAAARAEERAGPKRRARVDLYELLERCVAKVRERNRLPEGAVRLRAEPATAVRGDPGELDLIFNHLLDNAVKYSDEPVEVCVGVGRPSEGRVRVEIADRGVGIPPGELRRIFQRFHRASRDVHMKVSGLGLGLFIVRHLVRRQGGRVVARSEGAGRGSRFVVTLRAAPADAVPGAGRAPWRES